MRVVAESLEELDHLGVHVRVVLDVVLPLGLLLGVRELSLGQQVGHVEEARALGKLLDRIAAIPEDSPVAVDEGDGAAAGGGVHEGRVVGHQPEVFRPRLDLAQGQGGDGAVGDRDLVRFAGPVVGDRE